MNKEGIKYFTDVEGKLASHQDLSRRVVEKQPVVPVSMEVDISMFCGDRCSFCHFAYTHTQRLKTPDGKWDTSKIMTLKITEVVFKKLSKGGVKSVVFSGGGEPLDSPFALDIFKIAKRNGLELGMYTRGHGLKDELAEFVAEHFEWIVVSLDSTNSEDHKKIKGTNTFDSKVKNIMDFRDYKDRRANISVSMMVDSKHLKELEPGITKLESDIAWLLKLGVNEVQIRPIIDTGTYEEQRSEMKMLGLAYKTDEETWREHYSWIPEMKLMLQKYTSVQGLNPSLDKFDNVYKGTSGFDTCDGMVISSGLVGTDGTVYKCVNLRNITEIGNLTTQTMEDIFLDPNLDRNVDENCRARCAR